MLTGVNTLFWPEQNAVAVMYKSAFIVASAPILVLEPATIQVSFPAGTTSDMDTHAARDKITGIEVYLIIFIVNPFMLCKLAP